MSCPYDSWEPPTIAFCERRLCGWIAEPANAASNIIFLLVAGYLWTGYRTRHGALAGVTVGAFLIGIGSFLFHATATRAGEVLDLSAMYIFSSLFVAFNAKRLWRLENRATLGVLCALWALSVVALVASGTSGIAIFIAELVFALGCEVRLFQRDQRGVRYRSFFALISLFALSYFAWNMDYWRVWCDPDNHVFTGHAFWHVANGLCLGLFYDFHRQFHGESQTA